MKILAIETSCDETAIALLDIEGSLDKPKIKVLGNALYSQAKLHEKYGGVYPTLAKREHIKNLPILLEKVLEEAGITPPAKGELEGVDLIAVTSGPGLEPALWTGITFAEELGKKWRKPVVPINHMLGHVYSVLYNLSNTECLTLPGLALLVSGGHTELVLIKDFGDYKILGRTLDDAVGEAFDKVARMLGLPYPGGPEISALAERFRGRRNAIGREFPEADREQTIALRLPRPMLHSGDLNFSFSGLKTAVLYKIRELTTNDRQLTDDTKEAIAREFEDAAIEVLLEKTTKAIEMTTPKALIVAGGVSANKYLREKFKELNTKTYFPTPLLSTDNAIMIGIAAYIKVTNNPSTLERREEIQARGKLSIASSHLVPPQE